MANASKSKGTACESAVVKLAHALGFPNARRIALSGSSDKGDIDLHGDMSLIIECKAHKSFSDMDVAKWLVETERERINAGASDALLVLKRPGKGDAQVGSWWAVRRDALGHVTYRYLEDALDEELVVRGGLDD